jgi:hypothetical protein
MFNSSLIVQRLLHLKVKTDHPVSIFDEKVSLYRMIFQ